MSRPTYWDDPSLDHDMCAACHGVPWQPGQFAVISAEHIQLRHPGLTAATLEYAPALLPEGLQHIGVLAHRIVAEAEQRLGELAGSHGCEAAAEIARMEGRVEAARLILKVVEAS